MSISRRRVLGLGAVAALGAACAPAGKHSGTAAGHPSQGAATTPGAPKTTAPEQPPAPRGPATEIVHGPRSGNQVALTFHGSGDPSTAVHLLEEAERAGARLTIMAVGSWLASNSSIAARVTGRGHELGNHTYTHPVLPRLGTTAMLEEITRCRDLLRRLDGTAGPWFRPSGTPHADGLIRAEAGKAGYRYSLAYDVDPLDYTDPGSMAVHERVLAQVRPGSIVSLHTGHPGTVAALPDILSGLHARGLRAVTVSTLLRGLAGA